MTHTPDTDEVRACYGVGRFEMDADNGDHDAEFDRWFAAEESRIRADERKRIVEAIRDLALGHPSTIREDDAYNHAAHVAEEAEPFRDNRITHRICPPGCEETRPHYHRTDTVDPIIEEAE